jgi:succinoglycan biosynthesis transport protein ExoP
MEEQTLRLSDITRVLRRRGRIIVALILACTLASILIAALLPNRYQAETTLLVEPQSISSRLVDSATGEADLANRLHTMMMQILSRARLSRVIDDLRLYQDLSRTMTREDVISYMRDQIWIEPVIPALQADPKGRNAPPINTFKLFFRHDSPQTAAAVANRLASDFIDEHIRERVQVSGDTAEFIESELSRLAQRIREVDAQIAKIKSDNVGSLPEDRAANERLLQQTLEAIREASRRFSEAQSDMEFYRNQASMVRATEGSNNSAVSPAARARELEMQLTQLRSRGYTDRHPDVVMIQAELESLRARISGGAGSSQASIAEQEALAFAKRAELRAEAERQEIERLQKALAEVEQRLARSPRVQEQLDVLLREYQSLSRSFQDYSNKRLEATVAANMERRQKGEQFRVLEPAFPPSAPESPNRPLIVMVGLLLGLFLGGGVAILLEATNTSFHEPRSLQDQLRIPVLASIPGILLKSDLAERRRRLIRDTVAGGAVTGVVLLAAAVGYVYVNAPGLWPGRKNEAPASAAQTGAPPAPAAPAAAPTAPPGEPGAPASR